MKKRCSCALERTSVTGFVLPFIVFTSFPVKKQNYFKVHPDTAVSIGLYLNCDGPGLLLLLDCKDD